MAKATLDVGPTVDQTVIVAVAAVNNIGLTIADRNGPVIIRAGLIVDNAGAGSNTFTAGIRKNGVLVAGSARSIILLAASRQSIRLEQLDLAAIVGDAYTIEVNVAAVVVPTLLLAGQSQLLVEALGQDAALVAGIGTATA